jgi:hypothetical protein
MARPREARVGPGLCASALPPPAPLARDAGVWGRQQPSSIPRPLLPLLLLLLLLHLLVSSTLAEEFSVVFDTTKPLGLKLSSDLTVQGFHRVSSSKMPAEASGWIRVGDRLTAVNGKETQGRDLAAVVAMVASAQTPKRLAFAAAGGSNRTAEMASVFDGPQGIHGHEGVLELARDGSPLGSVPFLQAMFGGLTHCRPAPLTFVTPPHGCGAYRGKDKALDHIVLVDRGVCAFSDKAILAQQASALGVVVMNDQPGQIVRMPIDPGEKSDIAIPAVMIDQADAVTLKHLMGGGAKAGRGSVTAPPRSPLMGRLVRKGQSCKPWIKARVVGEASANAKAPGQEGASANGGFGDPSAPSGEVLVFRPERRQVPTPSPATPVRTSTPSVRGAATKLPSVDSNDENGHVHSEGYYSEADEGRGADGLLHTTSTEGEEGGPTDDAGLPIEAGARAMSGGARARRLLGAHAAKSLAEAGADGGGEGEDVLDAVEIRRDGESLATDPSPSGEGDGGSDSPAASPEAREAALRARAVGRHEYILAKSGGPTPQGQIRLVVADPPDGCERIIDGTVPAKGAALLVERGGCAFSVKAKHAAASGAALLLIINNQAGLFAPTTTATGGATEDKPSTSDSLVAEVPTVMVTKIAGRALRAALADDKEQALAHSASLEAAGLPADSAAHHQHHGASADAHAAYEGVTVSFVGDSKYAGIWEELMGLLDHTAWPAEAPARRKLYLRLSRLHHPDKSSGSADRFELLAYLYRRANFRYDPTSEPDFKDDYAAPMGGG